MGGMSVTGEINSTAVTLVNIYAPNFDKPQFFNKILNLISEINYQSVIFGVDFNCVLDNYLDKSTQQKRLNIKSKSSELLNTYIKNTIITDVWRIANQVGREYSFYS